MMNILMKLKPAFARRETPSSRPTLSARDPIAYVAALKALG